MCKCCTNTADEYWLLIDIIMYLYMVWPRARGVISVTFKCGNLFEALLPVQLLS